MKREEAMRRHPSYQSRINWLISEARREQADDVARRMLVDADAFMGGVPESPEVAEARMDAEAVTLANSGRIHEWHHSVSTARFGRLLDIVGPLLIVAVVVGVLLAVAMLGELAGGWPL